MKKANNKSRTGKKRTVAAAGGASKSASSDANGQSSLQRTNTQEVLDAIAKHQARGAYDDDGFNIEEEVDVDSVDVSTVASQRGCDNHNSQLDASATSVDASVNSTSTRPPSWQERARKRGATSRRNRASTGTINEGSGHNKQGAAVSSDSAAIGSADIPVRRTNTQELLDTIAKRQAKGDYDEDVDLHNNINNASASSMANASHASTDEAPKLPSTWHSTARKRTATRRGNITAADDSLTSINNNQNSASSLHDNNASVNEKQGNEHDEEDDRKRPAFTKLPWQESVREVLDTNQDVESQERSNGMAQEDDNTETSDARQKRSIGQSGEQRPGAYSKAPGRRVVRNRSLDYDRMEPCEREAMINRTLSADSESNTAKGQVLQADDPTEAMQEHMAMRKSAVEKSKDNDIHESKRLLLEKSDQLCRAAPVVTPMEDLSDEEIDVDEEAAVSDHPISPLAAAEGDSFLVEAMLVEDDGDPNTLRTSSQAFYEAEAVDEHTMLMFLLKTRKGRLVTAGVLLLVVCLAVGVGVAMQNTKVVQVEVTPPPTPAPTMAPTVEFTSALLPTYTQQTIEEDPDSPQALALEWLLDDPTLSTIPTWRKIQRFVLAALFYAHGGPVWRKSQYWLDYGKHECQWLEQTDALSISPLGAQMFRVCNTMGMVTDLELNANAMIGKLIPEVHLLHPSLESLNLADNALSGSIPSSIGLLTRLRQLDLSNAGLELNLPSEIGLLTNLLSLKVDSNSLRGVVPSELQKLRKLSELYLARNNFVGGLDSIQSLRNLTVLDISGCRIGFSLPTEMVTLTKLQKLLLANNNVFGSLPSQMGLLTNLRELDMTENTRVTGSIPSELGNLRFMEQIKLSRCGISGPFPAQLANLTNLIELKLSRTYLSSTLPAEIGKLTSLKSLELFANEMTGTIPSGVSRLSKLTKLDISYNYLSGPLPSEIWKLSALNDLDLMRNELTGYLDGAAMRNTSMIMNINLGMNSIRGTIPDQISQLTMLQALNLWDNDLSGTLPSSIGLLTNLVDLDVEENDLHGYLPTEIGNLWLLDVLWLSTNKFSGTIPTQLQKVERLFGLFLSDNEFTGPAFPTELGQLSLLADLVLSGNSFLKGSIPSEIALPQLSSLKISDCSFTGQIPSELWQLARLTSFDISMNSLSGTISTELCELTKLKSFDARGNLLTGSIPSEVGCLWRKMEEIFLSKNQLTSTIPIGISDLSFVESLDLSDNQLTGAIPEVLFNMSSELELLSLFNNNLTGTVPIVFCEVYPDQVAQIDCVGEFSVSCPADCCKCGGDLNESPQSSTEQQPVNGNNKTL